VDLGSAGERLTAPECLGNAELRRDGAGALNAAARDRGHRYPRHEAQRRDLHPTREPRADQPDPQRHNVVRQETVSVSSGTASNDASTATCPAAAVSSPVPRATTVRTAPVARTSTTPLSSAKPRATSFIMYRTPTVAPRGDTVSPRCSSGHGPAAGGPRPPPRSHTRPFPGPPPQRRARAGASNRTVSWRGKVTRACTRPPCSDALPQAAPGTASLPLRLPRFFALALAVPGAACGSASACAERG